MGLIGYHAVLICHPNGYLTERPPSDLCPHIEVYAGMGVFIKFFLGFGFKAPINTGAFTIFGTIDALIIGAGKEGLPEFFGKLIGGEQFGALGGNVCFLQDAVKCFKVLFDPAEVFLQAE